MAQSEALLTVLNNNEEPLSKRIKIADNAFKLTDLHIPHKEALLLQWIYNAKNVSHEVAWPIGNKWLSSEQFKNLTQNDITNDDISAIVELFLNQLQKIEDKDVVQKNQVIDGVTLLCDNIVFQQYFKYNLELYCKFLSDTLATIDSPIHLIGVLKNPCLFSKSYLVEKKFYKLYLHLIMPVLVKKVMEFKDNQAVFDEISKVIQKCIFNGNTKKFETFFAHCLEGQQAEKEHVALSKALFKYLYLTYDENPDITALSFKIVFHAFCQSFNESHMIYKFMICVVYMAQFNVKKYFSISFFKPKTLISLGKAIGVILTALDVLKTRNFTECEVSKISFTEFLRDLLKSLLFLRLNDSKIGQIILSCIEINPLVIEPIASSILVYVMIAYKKEMKQIYDDVVIAVLNVFGKLHRTEHFISKFIPAIKSVITGEKLEEYFTNIYSFAGLNDIKAAAIRKTFAVGDMLSEQILQSFTDRINGLASWQVINVFTTLLFHLGGAVDKFTNNNKQDFITPPYLEILGTLINRLLLSVRIADYNVPENVKIKLVKGLMELKKILKGFGPAILNREHNHITMRTFLNMSYVWGETYMTLSYYSTNNEIQMDTVIDNTFTACNLRYLHSHLDVKQWQLISQRITNFGEQPCKKLLQKLYIQKLRAMLLFEEHFNNDIVTNIVKTLQSQPEDICKDLLMDKFAVKFILPKMNKTSLMLLSENLIEDEQLHEIYHIRESSTLINAMTYVAMSKINKLFKRKRKHDDIIKKNLSSKIFALIPVEIFFTVEDYNLSEVIDNMKTVFGNREEEEIHLGIESKEDKLLKYLKLLKKFPFIYSSVIIQKSVLLYLFSLREDIFKCSELVKNELEGLIIGVLQTCKYQLTDIFNIEILGAQVLQHFQRYDVLFSLIMDNVFKHENCIKTFEPLVNCLTKNLDDSRHLSCSILVLNAVTKIKKSKMDSASKETAIYYKEKILSKIAKLVCKSEFLIEAYATCLKHYIDSEKNPETIKKLLDKLTAYIQYSLDNINNENKKGCITLFTTVLHNKQKIKEIEEDIVLKVWNACKKIGVGEEYSHLIKLIITLIPNDEFYLLVEDLLSFTENSIVDRNYPLFGRYLKTWESILTCDVNHIKMKGLQEALEKLVLRLLKMLGSCEYDEILFGNIVHFEERIIQTQRFLLSFPLIDMFILNISTIMCNVDQHFETRFNFSISILEKLLKHRNAMIMDRLPAFLQQYRIVLKRLCAKSNSDETETSLHVNKASDCAHKLEKLTKNLVSNKKDMGRIAVFLIADILERYEQINLYPNVKLHLNNCIYSLVALCDHHSVAYLMRVLSSASTEMFKILYEHYKKYYMFTGKV